jgi:hypothetical protein
MKEPKNERQACAGALRVLEVRRNEQIGIVSEPDRNERQHEAVEIVAASARVRFVLEHTRIESFPEQILDGKQFTDLLSVLETSLPSHLPPGTFEVLIHPRAAGTVPRNQQTVVRDAIARWVLQTAPTLKLGPDDDSRDDDDPWSVTEAPPDVPFEVTLQRTPPEDKTLLYIARFSPADGDDARRQRIRTALDRKCPKLFQAKMAEDALSVLILESDDIALANRHVISEAVVAEIQQRPDTPDVILLVETDRGLGWLFWVIKEGERQYPELDNPGPYSADGRQAI